jgi:hypothetical protein
MLYIFAVRIAVESRLAEIHPSPTGINHISGRYSLMTQD